MNDNGTLPVQVMMLTANVITSLGLRLRTHTHGLIFPKGRMTERGKYEVGSLIPTWVKSQVALPPLNVQARG